jgi:hypothetical protein
LLAKAKARAWDLITALDDLGSGAVLRKWNLAKDLEYFPGLATRPDSPCAHSIEMI